MITIENIKDTLEEININNNLIGKMAHFKIDGLNKIAVWLYSDEFDNYYHLIDIDYYDEDICISPHSLDVQFGTIPILDLLYSMEDEMLEDELEEYPILLRSFIDDDDYIKQDEILSKIKKSNTDDELFRELCMYTLDGVKEVLSSMIESLQNIYHDLLGKY